MQEIKFFVPGLPKTAGSKKAFAHPKTGKIIVLDDSGTPGKNWRKTVQEAARQHYRAAPLPDALLLQVVFLLPRPRFHFGTGRNAQTIKSNAPSFHTVKPDATKMLRSVEDALTRILWADDAQIVQQSVLKRYCSNEEQPGAWIQVFEAQGLLT